MVGNFIADAVKGKKYLNYDAEISKGIIMHREIDTYTDAHAIVKHSKSFFREHYGLFSSILIDVFYDHFLAKNWGDYSDQSLSTFAVHAYHVFEKYLHIMPDRNRMMFPYMREQNWLLNYANLNGIQQSMNGMSRRIKNHPGIEHATEELQLHYEELQLDFKNYFPKLIEHIALFTF